MSEKKPRSWDTVVSGACLCVCLGTFIGGGLGVNLGRTLEAQAAKATPPAVSAAPTQGLEATPVLSIPEAYSEQDLEVLALLIYMEAGGDACSDATRYMVGEVALNRVASPLFPDTLAEVATQRAQYGRLYWTGLVWPERASDAGEAHAVERAYRIASDLLEGTASRTLPEDAVYQSEHPQGEVLVYQDGLYFGRQAGGDGT